MSLLLLPAIGNEGNDGLIKLTPSAFGPPVDTSVDLLSQLVKIKISDDGRSTRPFSTPSVFRRALDLYSAMSNPDEWPGVSKIFTDQWRKMAMLLALSATYDLNIKFQKVGLDSPPEESVFLKICAGPLMKPLNIDPFARMNWPDSCYNIILDYKPPAIGYTDGQLVLGATSPSTLFFPADDFDEVVKRRLDIKLHIREEKKEEGLSLEDLSCVYDWMLWFRKANIEELSKTKLLGVLVNNFINDLFKGISIFKLSEDRMLEDAQLLDPEVRYPGWKIAGGSPEVPKAGKEGRFKLGAFTPEGATVENDVQYFNFSVKQKRDSGEWDALFIGLALNKLRNLKIEKYGNQLVVTRKGARTPIATFKEVAWVHPEVNVAGKIGLKKISIDSKKDQSVFVLSPFEWLCVYQYLMRLEKSTLASKNDLLHHHIDVFKAEIKAKWLEPFMSKTDAEVWKQREVEVSGQKFIESYIFEWEDNRFTEDKSTADKSTTAGLNALFFSIHAVNASFFEDIPHLGMQYEDIVKTESYDAIKEHMTDEDKEKLPAGYHHKKIIRPWFNVLAFIAFKDMRHLPVDYVDIDNTGALPEGLVTTSKESPLYYNLRSNYVLQGVRLGIDTIAVSTADTLFSVMPNGDEAMRDAFYTLLTRENHPRKMLGANNMHNRMEERGTVYNPANEFKVDSALYDFEITLFAQWLSALIDMLALREGADVSIKEGRDSHLLKELIERKKTELLNNVGINETSDVNLTPYYDASKACFSNVSVSTLKYFYGAIKDELFMESMVMYIGEGQLECKINNYVDDSGSPTVLGGVYTCENGNLKADKGIGIILPLTESACKHMYHSPSETRRQGDSTSGWYGLSFVEVYRKLFEDDNVFEISVLSQSTGITFPMIKQYSLTKNIVTALTIDDVLPAVAIWPDVEIEGWKSYAVSIINTLSTTPHNYGNISFPSFIDVNGSGPNPLQIDTLTVSMYAEDSDETVSVDPLFKTYTVEQYPRMLDVRYKDKPSGCIFVRPRWLNSNGTEEGTAYFASGNEVVTVGVDFGTTNSVAYIGSANNTPEPFALSLVESNYVTTKISDTFHSELPASIASQRRWLSDSDLSNVREGGTAFSSTLMLFNRNLNPLPFIHANIYRTGGLEIGNYAYGSLSENRRNYKYGMKWTESTEALGAFLGQFAIMCCVAAVKLRRGNVGAINFKASYPTSLTKAQEQTFTNIWNERVLGSVTSFSGFIGVNVDFYDESVSAGLACMYNSNNFFSDTEVRDPYTHGFVCMDIGGGSMDIAVIQKQSIVDGGNTGIIAHLSIPLAAQYMLTAGYIDHRNNDAQAIVRKFYEHLNMRMDALTNGLDSGKDSGKSKLPKRVRLLQRANAGFSKGLILDNRDIPDTDAFIHAIDTYVANCSMIIEQIRAIGRTASLSDELLKIQESGDDVATSIKHLSKVKMCLAGLMYFVGGIIKNLKIDKRFIQKDGGKLTVFMAGNGSKLVDWVLYNADELPKTRNISNRDILAQYVRAGMGDNACEIQILNSKRPKSEVAYGLVYADSHREIEPFTKYDVDKLIYEHTQEEDVFKAQAAEIFEAYNVEKNEYDAFKQDAIADQLTKLVNPDYCKESLVDAIADFVFTFYKISPKDFECIFDTRATTLDRAKEIASKYVTDIMNDSYKSRNPLPPISVRSYNGYAVLKFVMLMLKKV